MTRGCDKKVSEKASRKVNMCCDVDSEFNVDVDVGANVDVMQQELETLFLSDSCNKCAALSA